MANNYRDYFDTQSDSNRFDHLGSRQTDDFHFHSQSNTNTAMSSSPFFIWPKNSELSVTASNILSISSLNPNASEFIPKRHQNNIDSVNFSQREKLIRDINTGQLECLICLDKIQPYDSVWSCKTCFHIMHLNCIVQWAESSETDEGWRCCACQNISESLPREYYCFCGKTKNPKYNQYNQYKTAHSCGNVCGRTDRDNCPHSCVQPCHPGRCPECQVNEECAVINFALKLQILFLLFDSFARCCVNVAAEKLHEFANVTKRAIFYVTKNVIRN